MANNSNRMTGGGVPRVSMHAALTLVREHGGTWLDLVADEVLRRDNDPFVATLVAAVVQGTKLGVQLGQLVPVGPNVRLLGAYTENSTAPFATHDVLQAYLTVAHSAVHTLVKLFKQRMPHLPEEMNSTKSEDMVGASGGSKPALPTLYQQYLGMVAASAAHRPLIKLPEREPTLFARMTRLTDGHNLLRRGSSDHPVHRAVGAANAKEPAAYAAIAYPVKIHRPEQKAAASRVRRQTQAQNNDGIPYAFDGGIGR